MEELREIIVYAKNYARGQYRISVAPINEKYKDLERLFECILAGFNTKDINDTFKSNWFGPIEKKIKL